MRLVKGETPGAHKTRCRALFFLETRHGDAPGFLHSRPIPESKTEESLKDPRFRILIVNNKFQTGYDEPMLHTMYVDKKFGGLQCVQTLSRLNRTMSGKTDTFVLDFVNDPDVIQESFQPYYQGTILTEETDPNRLYTIEQEVKKYNLFQDETVNQYVDVFYDDVTPLEEYKDNFSGLCNSCRV